MARMAYLGLLLEPALPDLKHAAMSFKGLEVGLLVPLGRGVVAYACGEVSQRDELLMRLEQAPHQAFKVEPEVTSAVLPDPVIEVEAVDIGGNSLGGPHAVTHLAAPPHKP